jgi:6-phosphogluconolactonase
MSGSIRPKRQASVGLPPESKLVPGAPRGPVGAPGGPPLRNTDNDIWAADLHLTPNGKFLYMTERTSSSLGTFSVDGASGKLITCLKPEAWAW